MHGIISLLDKVKQLKAEDKALFNRFFEIDKCTGRAELPKEMHSWAEDKFGSVSAVEKQEIVRIYNRFSFETALFNHLRAMRPVQAMSNMKSLKAEIKKSLGDPFCKPLKMTPADSFGRVKGKYCISASNAAKYDALHGLIIFNKHNPLDFSEKEVVDYFRTAQKWFSKAHKNNPEAAYPFLLWNCLWRSGASIMHGHMQLLLGEKRHYAEAEMLNMLRQGYAEDFKSDYFNDMYRAHKVLGLGLEWKGIKVFASLVPRKKKEITLISKNMDDKTARAVFRAVSCMVNKLGVKSFNLGVIMPRLSQKNNSEWKGFPVIARIVDRGSLENKVSDIGGMEMYAGSNVIADDPYKVFENIKKSFEK